MRSVIRNLRAAMADPQDYDARSNLMWDAAMAESRIIRLGKRTDFECRQMAHQLAAYTNCNHGAALAVLLPPYYRRIVMNAVSKFERFAVNVWGISPQGMTGETLARAGLEALAGFIRESGLPTTLESLGVDASVDLKAVAGSCAIVTGGYRRLNHEEILGIFLECQSQ